MDRWALVIRAGGWGGGGGGGVSCMGRFIMPGSLLQWEILEFVVPVVLLYREAGYGRFFTLRGFRCSYTEGSLLRFGGLFHQEVSYVRRLLKLGEGGIVIITCIRGYELHVGYWEILYTGRLVVSGGSLHM